MRAVSRVGKLLLAGVLALAPVAALAQQAPAPSNPPATDAVGPQALQNFTLNGTVTHAADQPTPVAPAPQKVPQRSEAQASPDAAASPPSADVPDRKAATSPSTPPVQKLASAAPPPAAPAAEAVDQAALSGVDTLAKPQGTTAGSIAPPPSFAPAPEPTGNLASSHSMGMLPWLLAAFALAIGGAFLFWRNRDRQAFAGGPQVDAFIAPEPALVPAPAPPRAPTPVAPAPKPADPSALGFVSTRLRPWIEIGFQPMRCILEDQRVIVEFELELFNSGSAPAQGVLIEASLFNAGPTQDQQIGGFFANPVGAGERIVAIPPLKRIAVSTRVTAPREQVQAYEVAGRQVFIPLIAFNALYSWSSGEGQTSLAYLLGRDTKGEKVGPFRLDQGPRIFRGLAARLLPDGVRR